MNKTTTLCLTAATRLLRSISNTLSMQNIYTPLRQGKRLTASVLLVFTFLFGYVGEGWGQSVSTSYTNNNGATAVIFTFFHSNSYAILIYTAPERKPVIW